MCASSRPIWPVRTHVAVGRRGAVAVKSTPVVRPVRPWVQQPYYGAVFDGVTLGAAKCECDHVRYNTALGTEADSP